MSDLITTFVCFALTALLLWCNAGKPKAEGNSVRWRSPWFIRKPRSGYIRWQWRRPWWILLRLAIVFLLLGGLFSAIGIPVWAGFLIICIGVPLLMVADWSDGSLLLLIPVFCVYEWVYWFPSRREYVLKNPRPEKQRFRKDIVGSEGITMCDLKPTGSIEINGQAFPAITKVGFIGKGESVIVDSVGDFELRVRRSEAAKSISASPS